MLKAGTILQLWRYPVKSIGGELLQSAELTSFGVPADRLWALRDETTGRITNGKKLARLMQCRARVRPNLLAGLLQIYGRCPPR